MKIIKRDGRLADFNPEKIESAILKSFNAVDGGSSAYAKEKADNIARYIYDYAKEAQNPLTVDEIQNLVEHGLMST